MNLSTTIAPKSDQLNSDSLISGPITITITRVDGGSKEQPVIIHFENENGRPYKPGLSMRRMLVIMWGGDGAKYIGRKLTLYRDPSVPFGGQQVGGIRISHASDIDETITVALTITKGRKAEFTVEPLSREESKKPAQPSPQPTDAQPRDLQTLCDLGDSKATEGFDALGAWWAGISKQERTTLGAARIDAWKARASA